jgi:SAM-dependent methyltransferase
MISVSRIAQGMQARIHRHLLDPWQDRRLGIKATGLVRPSELRLEGRNAEHSNEYFGTPSLVLDRGLDALQLDHPRFVFVDLGCGKGRVLLRAAMRPFRRVEGIELSGAMHEVAVENIELAKPLVRAPVVARHGDVTEYELPTEPLVLYLFNAFGSAVIVQLLQNLEASLRAHPRECYFIYLNPVHKEQFARCSFLQEMPRPGLAKIVDRLISPWPLATYRYAPAEVREEPAHAGTRPNGGGV